MHRLHINVSCWMRGYYSSWDGALRTEEYDTAVLERNVSERDSAVILKKKTYWAITVQVGKIQSVSEEDPSLQITLCGTSERH